MNKKNGNYTKFYLLPIILSIGIVPLIVRLIFVDYPLKGLFYEFAKPPVSDFFSCYKSIIFILTTILALLLLILRKTKYKSKLSYHKFYIPAGLYMAFILLSWLLSPYKFTATFGYIDRYEGSLVLLGYIIILCYTFNIFSSKYDFDKLYKYIFICFSIFGVLGLTQLANQDFFQSPLGKHIITPIKHWNLIDQIKFRFGNGTVYGTLYNINYTGPYVIIILPLVIYYYLTSNNKAIRIASFILSNILIIDLFGSKSSGGMVALLVVLPLMFVLMNKRLKIYYKSLIPLVLCFGFIFAGFNTTIKSEVSHGFDVGADNDVNYHIKDLEMKNHQILIDYDSVPLEINLEFEGDTFLTKFTYDNNDLDIVQNGHKITFNETELKDFYVLIVPASNEITFNLYDSGKEYPFVIENEGNFKFHAFKGCYEDIVDAPHFGFTNKENFGSNRGYIWSRTLPLIPKNIIIGSGADTFIYQFPHNDFFAKYQTSPLSTIYDKPHNMFLGIAINTGLISLISVLILFAIYFFETMYIIFISKIENEFTILSIFLLLSFIGFMITALVNDSSLSVSPVFWAFLGLGFASNRLYFESKKIIK